MRVSKNILKLFENHPVNKIDENNLLTCTHDSKDNVYLIKKGAIKIFKHAGSIDFIFAIGFEGEIIGLEQVILEEVSDKSYVALKNSEIVCIPVSELKNEILKNEELLPDILHYVSDFSDQLEHRIVNLNQKSVINNFATLLYSLSKLKVNEIVPHIISTKDIASLIGTTTNYVYKTIQKLEDKSIITFKDRKLRIINKELLKKLALEKIVQS
ncbi:MAG: Crp/Fnr family transcriptional regulator [Sphingobacteriaceae bacterium]|nr:Crp/Fnr family transcriptional regulator [Sphingobacteriaceae bacterium]